MTSPFAGTISKRSSTTLLTSMFLTWTSSVTTGLPRQPAGASSANRTRRTTVGSQRPGYVKRYGVDAFQQCLSFPFLFDEPPGMGVGHG